MQTDSRQGLNIAYNFLNLVSRVTSDNQVKASYTWLSDGTKLRVADATGNGFYYLGSLIYQQNNGVLQLETADFGDGVILSTASGGQEVHYFLRDHLGSVRVIVDGMGIARERNDYFPFGKHRVVAGGSEVTNNRFKYNGKEFQTTGNLNYLDYGARMYDTELGRWFGVDPMAENYLSNSPYHFSGNNPVMFVNDNGMDYWSTSNPELIEAFMGAFRSQAGCYYQSFDLQGWYHATDAEFRDDLTYNDKLGRFFYDYGDVVDGVATRFSRSLPGYTMFDGGIGIRTYNGMDESQWYRRASGRVDRDYTIEALMLPTGKGLGILKEWFGKIIGNGLAKSSNILRPLGLGSTGRTTAVNLTEQLAIKEAMSKPVAGQIVQKNTATY